MLTEESGTVTSTIKTKQASVATVVTPTVAGGGVTRPHIPGPTLPLSERHSQVTPALGGVTVIVPVYNEQGVVASTVRELSALMRQTGRAFELIVVDDGSTDATPMELAAFDGEPGIKVLRNLQNRGYGFSLKRAVLEAQHEIIVITDADGTYPNERIGELIDLLDGVDMVVGARTGKNVNVPLIRRPAKWCLRKLASYLAATDIPDLNSGLRVMKRPLIKQFFALLPDGFSFTTTITLALLTHTYQVRYVPIDYRRRIGSSSIRPIRDTLNFISLIVRTVLYFKPLKIFAPLSAMLLFIAVAVAVSSKIMWGTVADVTSVTLAMASIQTLAIGLLADLIEKRSPGGIAFR